MPLRDDLLNPIAGPSPTGADLRYDPVYDQVKEARREDDDAPQGDWQRERKTADFAAVVKLAGDALATKSKDLQLAAWLTEALLRREGFAGLRAGLELLRGLLDQFWEGLYPELEDDDVELRVAPLEWVGLKLDTAVRQVPLDRAGHGLLKFNESRTVLSEAAVADDYEKQKARNASLAEGKLAPEDFDQAVAATPKAWYKQLLADIEGALAALAALDATAREKFGPDAPNFSRLRSATEEVRGVARQFLAKKLETDPDPVEEVPDAAAAGDGTGSGEPAAAGASSGAGATLAAEPANREDAVARVAAGARFLRRAEPQNPGAYLLLRGLRWGEVRAGGDAPDPRLLEAPPTHVRTQLKALLLDRKWPQLLEAAEVAMGTPAGRGWLDLQRYALAACEGLGSEYVHVAAAIRTELRALLADVPRLPEMALMDDTPTANAETRAWLAAEFAPPEQAPPPAEDAAADGNGRPSGSVDWRGRFAPDAYARAQAEAKAGRTQRAIELLVHELGQERSRRGRFIRQQQLVGIMLEAGLAALAMPIVEEMMARVTDHKLDDWEAPDWVAQSLALYVRCMRAVDGDSAARDAAYLRICRLDPVQAMSLAPSE